MTRMSDVFELPVDGSDVATGAYGVIEDKDDGVTPYDTAAHAINTHDKLIDLLSAAVHRTVIDTTDVELIQWMIDALEVLDGEL